MSSAQARDDGLRRISTVTRWVAAVGVAGTAVLAGFVYRLAPGSSSASTVSTPAGTSTPGVDANATGSAPVDPNAGFQAPAAAPVPAQQAPVVRSGGS